MPRNGKDGWTEEHRAVVRREWKAGTTVTDLAAMLGRSDVAIRNAASRLGLQCSERNTAAATKRVGCDTPAILEMWRAGESAELIADKFNRTVRSIQVLASYHKVRRPAWYLSDVRAKIAAVPRGVAN